MNKIFFAFFACILNFSLQAMKEKPRKPTISSQSDAKPTSSNKETFFTVCPNSIRFGN